MRRLIGKLLMGQIQIRFDVSQNSPEGKHDGEPEHEKGCCKQGDILQDFAKAIGDILQDHHASYFTFPDIMECNPVYQVTASINDNAFCRFECGFGLPLDGFRKAFYRNAAVGLMTENMLRQGIPVGNTGQHGHAFCPFIFD
ncbi:MAG: hypothetical protein Q9M23_08380, partial [Mariprofundaceae bacterium]|nr:hypothetical protein [Mariprofundaceae bacterium]